jgi:hypothetical protein
VFYIVHIIGDFFVEAIFLSSSYLSHASDARLGREHLMMPLLIELDFTRLMRARSYERHTSAQYVPELREFIERESFDDFSDMCFSWIVRDLVEGSRASIGLFLERFFILECLIFQSVYTIGIFD